MVEKTGDELECENIRVMSVHELLDYVLVHPEYLTDSYYRVFRTAVIMRHSQLTSAVHVVMGNDFPAAVFSTEASAKAYCAKLSSEPRPHGYTQIYWRHYEFELDKKKEK